MRADADEADDTRRLQRSQVVFDGDSKSRAAALFAPRRPYLPSVLAAHCRCRRVRERIFANRRADQDTGKTDDLRYCVAALPSRKPAQRCKMTPLLLLNIIAGCVSLAHVT